VIKREQKVSKPHYKQGGNINHRSPPVSNLGTGNTSRDLHTFCTGNTTRVKKAGECQSCQHPGYSPWDQHILHIVAHSWSTMRRVLPASSTTIGWQKVPPQRATSGLH